MTEENVRENRVRRVAEMRGFKLKKSRRRDPSSIGGYMLVDALRNFAVLGAGAYTYSATLDDVEQYLSDGHKAGKTDGR